MKLIIDNREHALIRALTELSAVFSTETLVLGDVVIRHDDADLVVFERKAVADLVASIKDGRYGDQSLRLSATTLHRHNIVYIIEGTLAAAGQMVYSALTSLLLYKGFSVLTTTNAKASARLIAGIFAKMQLNGAKSKPLCYVESQPGAPALGTTADNIVKLRKADNITIPLFARMVLCQVPNVSLKTAEAVLAHFGTLNALADAVKTSTDGALDELKINNRKISKSAVANIRRFIKEA